MPPLIYQEGSDNKDSSRDPPSADLTPDPRPPSEKPTEKPSLEPDYDALSEPSAPMREGSLGEITPKDIVRYQKGSDPTIFSAL